MATTMTAINVAFTALSDAGNEFIKRRNRRGYWFWLVGNALGLAMFILQHQWVTALLYVYFTVSCIQGLRHWARAEVGENAGEMKSMPAGPRNIGPKASMPEYLEGES